MFIGVLFFMLIFTGSCGIILALAISDAYGQKGSDKPISTNHTDTQ